MKGCLNMRLSLMLVWVLSAGCAIVQPGERGLRQTLGRLHEDVQQPGPVLFNPFLSNVVTVPVRTTRLEVKLPLPTQEGLTVASEVSVLYRVREEAIKNILETIGPDYEESVVLPAFRSAAAAVASKHAAKDMHSGARARIEGEIADQVRSAIGDRGFIIEAVLLKSIQLPDTLSSAIQAKLAAEQEYQRMQFVLDSERREAERRRIEAEGIRDAQGIVDQGLSPLLIQWKAIEAFRELAASPNSKIIFTDGRSPMLLPQGFETTTPSRSQGSKSKK
jgi:regulator of protease activity HflC (stomatin/prohibitin superfamily)